MAAAVVVEPVVVSVEPAVELTVGSSLVEESAPVAVVLDEASAELPVESGCELVDGLGASSDASLPGVTPVPAAWPVAAPELSKAQAANSSRHGSALA